MRNREAHWKFFVIFLLFLLVTSIYWGYPRTYKVSEGGTNAILREAPAIKLSYWGRVYGEGYAYSLDLVRGGGVTDGVIVVGVSPKKSHGLWILRRDYYGKIIWEKVYGEDVGYKNAVIRYLYDGGAIVITDYKDGVIALKLDSEGEY